jgi:hypothetical protein
MKMRELGYSEQSPSDIKENPTKWFELILMRSLIGEHGSDCMV